MLPQAPTLKAILLLLIISFILLVSQAVHVV